MLAGSLLPPTLPLRADAYTSDLPDIRSIPADLIAPPLRSMQPAVRRWHWPGSDAEAAHKRLQRLNGKSTFIAQEVSTTDIEAYLGRSGVVAPRTFQALPFHNHTDAWVLRDMPARAALRRWLKNIRKDEETLSRQLLDKKNTSA